MSLILALHSIVVGFEFIEMIQVIANFQQFFDQFMFLVAIHQMGGRGPFLNRTHHLNDQHTMMGDDGSPTLTGEFGMGNPFSVTHMAHGVDDVVGIFLKGVIGGTLKGRPTTVIIDTKTTPYIHSLNVKTHLV